MHIPSYDDLTPPISDVSQADVFASVERVLPGGGPVCARAFAQPYRGTSALYACIRARRAPEAAMAIAREFSPRIERYAGCVVADVSGLGRLLGDAHAIGAEVDKAAAVRGGMTVAVAPTQIAALVLAHARPSLTVVTGDAAAALCDVPLAILQQLLNDIDGATTEQVTRRTTASAPRGTAWHRFAPLSTAVFDVLRRWGLTTLGELAALPAADLSERIGQHGLAVQRLACGLDVRPLVPDPGVPRFVETLDLEWPIDGLEPLSFVLARLLDRLTTALERADRGAAAIRLDLRLVDRTTHSRLLQLPASMRDAKVLRTLLLLDLESHPAPAGVDAVTIEIDPAPSRIVQYSLLERALPSSETLATLTARLSALVGQSRCGSPALLDTHRADGFEMRPFAPAAKREHASLSKSSAADKLPVAVSPPLRRYRPPIAVRVHLERGRPVHVAIDRRRMPGGAVEQCAGPWRTSGAWWEGAGAHWDRDEWDVGLGDGSLCRLFRDRSTGVWFLDGVFD